jgi:hypothetical protein
MSLPIPSDNPIRRVQGEVEMRYVPARAPPSISAVFAPEILDALILLGTYIGVDH